MCPGNFARVLTHAAIFTRRASENHRTTPAGCGGTQVAIYATTRTGGRMNAISSLVRPQQSDPQAVKQWAAEDFAISIGLLRECPYHGQPYKAHRHGVTSKALAAGLVDPL